MLVRNYYLIIRCQRGLDLVDYTWDMYICSRLWTCASSTEHSAETVQCHHAMQDLKTYLHSTWYVQRNTWQPFHTMPRLAV